MQRSKLRLTLWERIQFAPFLLELVLTGRRFAADPFETWSKHCPACGSSYVGHEQTVFGVAFSPAPNFVSAVENREWERALELGAGSESEPLGHRAVIMAWALRCPAQERLVVFLANHPGDLTLPQLVSQQVLPSHLTEDLLPHLKQFRPAVQDTFTRAIEFRRKMRAKLRGAA